MYSELHVVIFQRLLEGDVNFPSGQSCHVLKLAFHFNPPFSFRHPVVTPSPSVEVNKQISLHKIGKISF